VRGHMCDLTPQAPVLIILPSMRFRVWGLNGLNGGPCRDRTYDQLIKRNPRVTPFRPLKTTTYTSTTVPRFTELCEDKALN
jgi:hypothetical protein